MKPSFGLSSLMLTIRLLKLRPSKVRSLVRLHGEHTDGSKKGHNKESKVKLKQKDHEKIKHS